MVGRVFSIQVSGGGVPKGAVDQAIVGIDGLVGDGHDDKVNHGGPDRAVCLYSLERIRVLRAEGHPVAPGTMGENITLEGLDSADVIPGDRLQVGDIEIEVTDFATPCKTIRDSFIDGGFSRVLHRRHPGDSRLYARVLRGGTIRRGDPVTLAAPAAQGEAGA
ncbi:MAG TPA: MOSC domain-containing protein [Candidatus Dormibacteraeota bacterium]|nr:MOSC domain-containing protein [Candidatus Dormibacteraeota bacterium]